MKNIYPKKLNKGDEMRIVALSQSLAVNTKQDIQFAKKRLENLGFKVSFSKKCLEKDIFNSTSIKNRIDDLNDAFENKNIKAILVAEGGFNANQLLPYLDFELIRKNLKIICGYSDITVITNAIYAKTGLICYQGPVFADLAMQKGFGYTQEYFEKCLMQDKPFEIKPSKQWSDDKWWEDQKNRKFYKNKGWWIINKGQAEGKILGGDLFSFYLLQGTEYMPDLTDSVLFLEDGATFKDKTIYEFDRSLESLLQEPNADKIKGLVIGRFRKECKITKKLLTKMIKAKKVLKNIPIIANVDFGHTTPRIIYPIGGKVSVMANKSKVQIKFE